MLCVIGVAMWLVMPSSLEYSVVLIGAGIGFIPGCDCWCGGRCSFCLSPAPQQFQIIVADMGDDPTYGENCTNYNGTFVLDFVTQASNIQCRWSYELSGPYCTGSGGTALTHYWLDYNDVGGPGGVGSAIVRICNATRTACDNNTWSANDTATINFDCEDINDTTSTHSFGLADFCCVPGGAGPGAHTIEILAL